MSLHGKRWIAGVALLVVAGWSYGAVAFLAADGSLTWSLPPREAAPAQLHNLASYRYGPTVRASSFQRDDVSHHHPGFLVDGRQRPTLVEKWCSGTRDGAPWIEISWRAPRRLSEVKIWHAGSREARHRTVHRYRLRCLSARQPAPTLEVIANEQAIATHPLACEQARGIRIDWTPNAPGERARAYEIEAWGQ